MSQGNILNIVTEEYVKQQVTDEEYVEQEVFTEDSVFLWGINMNKYYLGTAIKITTILDIDTADTANIVIKNSGNGTEVSSTAMTKDQDKVYYYVWQSTNNSDDTPGTYTAEITITSGGYTSYTEKQFEMVDPD